MTTLTASTGNVNLTTPTGWSPAQIPQDGDDLIIGAATLNLDADLTLNTVTFNNASSRMAVSGTPRTVQATNGWFIVNQIGIGVLVNTALNSQIVTLLGRWSLAVNNSTFRLFQSLTNSSELTLTTVGYDQSAELFSTISAANCRPCLADNVDVTSKLNSYGRLTTGTGEGLLVNGANLAGEWNHFSVGLNSITQCYIIGIPGKVTINGDFTYKAGLYGDVLWGFPSNNAKQQTFNGTHRLLNNTSFTYVIFEVNCAPSGKVTLNGSASCDKNGTAVRVVNGIFEWKNQTASIPQDEHCIIIANGGFVDFTNLLLTVNGDFLFVNNRQLPHVFFGAVISCSSTGNAAAANSSLSGQIVKLPSPAPTLPAIQNVSQGVTYGYSGALLTGTALLLDPAILASAISANIPDIVDGVHEADTRDYDDIPGSIGFEFKKLRQANPFIEFEVTDDITPTDTEFAVSITDVHDDGSFQDSVLCFTEGDLTYDNNPILSLVKHTGYSVITLQRPMRVAPEVGDRGIINPLSHVYSIEETQDGLALEATSQSILTAIGEIDVDFAPVETLINVSTQTILAAIAEEDDPTNVINLQIAIKDQNDIGVAGVYVSIHGTAKSTVTNINGVAELWVNPNTNYNLRFVVPPGYTPLPEKNIVVGINDIEEVYVSPQIATPSIPEELCELRIYIKSQGTTEVGSLENIRVNAKLIDDYKIVNQNLFINIIDVAESDENGYVALVLLKDTDYVLSLTRENSIVIKRILIKTTNNAVQTLSEVVNA